MTSLLRLDLVSRVHHQGQAMVQALSEVTMAVDEGQLVAVMGPSGSGKSTLLNLAGGLDQPTAGTVTLSGIELGSLNPGRLAALRRATVGYVFQELNLVGGLTAAENVALPLELDGVSLRHARAAAVEALDSVGLPGIDRFPDAMSGGEQQRVAIARAIVGNRRLILADEPTGALDSASGQEIIELLRQRCDQGAAAVVVTHEPRYAAWADRVVYLRDGQVVERSSVGSGAGR